MKKLVTIILAIAIIFAISATAFAADASLTINGDTNRTYVGYKLLDLTTSHKADVNCEGNHDKDCYNYAYTVAAKYRDILQKEVSADAPDDVTDEQIIEYFAGQTSGDYDTLREVADRIYKAIKAEGLGTDQDEFDGTANIAQGYWMFADTTNLDDQNAANSFVMVNTKGENELEITPKTALPTIKKEVYDVDPTGTDGWSDSADHDINDDVQFKLTATLADNFAYYDTYKLIFHDNLADGFTLDADSIVVTAKNGDTVLDITDKYAVKTAEIDCDFEVVFENVKAIADVNATTVFEVTYTAKLNNDAVIGTLGNDNEVTLEFSNDPYSDSTGTTSDKVNVYTYKLIINKVDAEGNALQGAGFILYKKNAEGTYEPIGDEVKGDGMTTFTWTGLDDGDYKLEEKTVPAGYNKMADKEFTITATHTVDEITALNGIGTSDLAAGTLTEKITNQTGALLPETGAMGTVAFIGVGSMLIMVAAVFMITRKKMSVYED